MSSEELSSLKKDAHRVESRIHPKLSRYSELSSKLRRQSTSRHDYAKHQARSVEDEIDIDYAETLGDEIQEFLSQLTDIVQRMSALAGDGATSRATSATVDRYRDVLRDLTTEFDGTKRTIDSHMARKGLFGSRTRDEDGLRPRTDILLQESDSIQNSLRSADESLAIAMESASLLENQGRTFRSNITMLDSITKKYPVINNVVGRIRRVHQRDRIVIAATFAICLTVLLLYWWNS